MSQYIKKEILYLIRKAKRDRVDPIDLIEQYLDTDPHPKKLHNSILVKDLLHRTLRYPEDEQRETISTGSEALDKALGGYRKGEFIIVAGRPGMGTTHFLLRSMNRLANNLPVLFISYELNERDWMRRYMLINYGVRHLDMLNGKQMMGRRSEVENQLTGHEFFAFHDKITAMDDLLELISTSVRHDNIGLVVLDYYQLICSYVHLPPKEIAFGLKKLAADLGIAIVLVSQLSRELEYRGGDKRPLLSDLRDHGELEILADKILLFYRPSYYGFMEDESGEDCSNRTEIIIARDNKGINNMTVWL